MKFRAEDLHRTYCRYFRTSCCFDEVFLMALTSTEQLFIERPLYRRFLRTDHLPYFQWLIFLQCDRLYNFPSFRRSHWRCSIRKGVLRNFAKFTGIHLRQSLSFNKVAGWGDFLVCFISTEERNEKKEIHWWS